MGRSNQSLCILLPILWRGWAGITSLITPDVDVGAVAVRAAAAFARPVRPRRSEPHMRVLVTVSPLMYREAIALSLHRHRPGFEVRLAPPEATQEQVREFGPHLLV